jgi:signal transduction histidine kinase
LLPAVCVTLSLAAIALFLSAIPARFAQIQFPTLEVAAARQGLGVSPLFVAVWYGLIEIGIATAFVSVGVVIALRRPRERMAWFTSLALILAGVAMPPTVSAINVSGGLWELPATLTSMLALGFSVIFCYVFPNGSCVPHFTRVVAIALLIGLMAVGIASVFVIALIPRTLALWIVIGFVIYLTAALAQLYRYRYVSTLLERQQTKWLLFGLAAALLNFGLLGGYFLITDKSARELYTLVLYPVFYGFAPLIVLLSIAAAIFQYRLWDIHLVLNRSLVYGALTGIVVSGYVVTVAVLDAVFRTTINWWVSLIATGSMALLFQPVRQWLQRRVNRWLYGEGDEPYTVLRRLGQTLKNTRSPEDVLPNITETIARSLKLPYAAIALIHDDHSRLAAEYLSRHQWEKGDAHTDLLRLPLRYQSETIGELRLAPRSGQMRFSETEEALLRAIAHETGLVAYSLNLNHELQHARQSLVQSREAERLRLRRDLHDGLSPTLANLALQMETARDLVSRDPALAQEMLTEMAGRTRAVFTDLRAVVHNLRPPELDELGLVAAIQHLARQAGRTGLQVTPNLPASLPPLSPAVEVAAYRIAQEALSNVQRHSDAKQCYVRLSVEDNCLRLHICDDGQGLSAEHPAGVGLRSMRQRAEELSGEFQAGPLAEDGTSIQVRLPLKTE